MRQKNIRHDLLTAEWDDNDLSVIEHILRQKPHSTGRILDCGCGDGSRAISLAARGRSSVVGLDRSFAQLAAAREHAAKRHAEIQLVEAEPLACPFPDGTFDDILLLGALFGRGLSPRADVELLLEMQRILKPDGDLWLSIPDGDWIRRHGIRNGAEPLPCGFIYRGNTLTNDGNCLRTHIVVTDQERGTSSEIVSAEWLYSKKQATALLYQLGFRAIAYHDPKPARSVVPIRPFAPRYLVSCQAPSRRSGASALPRLAVR